MAQLFEIHTSHPQQRLIKEASKMIQQGGIAAIPTDSSYALVCHLDDQDAVQRLRKIRALSDKQHLTLLCQNMAEIANYAQVNDQNFRILKRILPGSYTFILEATKAVPRKLSHPSKKTIGIRQSPHPIVLALLEEHGQALISTSLILPGSTEPLEEAEDIRHQLQHQLSCVIDTQERPIGKTTVIDLTQNEPELIRQGDGDWPV